MIKGLAFGSLIADKAFDANWIIEEMNERGAKICISQRPNRTAPLEIDGRLGQPRRRPRALHPVGAFDLPDTPEDAAPRESIEVRPLVVIDD